MNKKIVGSMVMVLSAVSSVSPAFADPPTLTPVPIVIPAPPQASEPATGGGPKIVFATPIHDFGKIKGGENVRHEFIFTNVGDALLEISAVRPSCGCTTSGEWSKQVEPGKTGLIPIQFNSGNFGGAVFKTVTVTSNDKEQPNVTLQFKGTIWKPVDVSPQFAVLNANIENLSDARAVVRIVCNEETPVDVFEPQGSNPSFGFELKTNTPGKEYELTVKGTSQPSGGNTQGAITLKTSSTNAPTVTVTTMLILQPVLVANPPQIGLPVPPLAEPAFHLVSIRNNGTNNVSLSDATVNAEGVTAKLTETEPGRGFEVSLGFPKDFELKLEHPIELTVKTTHKDFPVLKVGISQAPRPQVAIPVFPNPSHASVPPQPPAAIKQ